MADGAAPWGTPYGYGLEEEEEEEVDNDRPDDEDFDVDEEMEAEAEGEDEEDEEPEYQDDSDDDEEEADEEEELDEEDEEDARQLRAVAGGTPLYQVAAPAVVAAATTGIKRRRDEDEWQPHAQAAAPAASGGGSQGPGKRNVVRINLRQQTIRPNYVEEPDEDAGQPQRLPLQQAQAAALQQMLQQPGAAAAAPAAAQWQAVPPPPASAVVQQPAVPDWAAHLPPAPQSFQPAHPPWMRKVASGGALAQQSKQSSGSAAWGGAKAAQFNRSTTPGFYAESDEEDEQDSKARRARKVPHVLLPEDELAALDDEVEKVIMHRDRQGLEANPADPWATREFFIKWARYSYLHCTWELKATCAQLPGFKRILNYIKKVEAEEARRPWLSREEAELLDVTRQMEEEMVEEYKQVERIIGERHWSDGTVKYLCKWKGLPYCEATYETAAQLDAVGQGRHVREFQDRERRILESRKTVEAQRRVFAESGARAFTQQPDFLKSGTLRDYQLDGLNWMVYSWSRGHNGILADEMGLGKTVQCASMVGYLSEVQMIAGPFLVVVPLSTVPNWIREFRKWIPSVNAIVYVGDAQSREVLRAFEWETGHPGGRRYKFDVLITTYEMVLKDSEMLSPIKWAYMMVDEAHRLKNDESALYKELISWSFKNKLLVTGTPLQNNIRELWALLHFLHPEKFPDCAAFEDEYNMQDPESVARLHATLRPHLLRRVIKDVEKSLPPKNEHILRVGMTPLQRQYYRWILTRNFKELNKGTRSQLSLLNIITELKKTCNHPFLFQTAEEEYRLKVGGDDDVATRLVVTSGKMVLLDKLLKRLFATKHRVLIFSQMVRVLDIISDYMRLRGYQHQRLDGSTPAHKRHEAMDHFNAPGSSDFAFLLSTRAGGLGINLATADTVIIFDSDWNPQNDLQAMSRAHRIGQKDTVNIYRFVTSGSVEEDILERAKKKMVLDHLVIQRMDTSGRTVLGAGGGQEQAKQMFGKEEMAAILRFGAEDLFREDEAAAEARGHAVVEEDLDAILARAEVIQDQHAEHGKAPGAMGDLLGQFNVATFKTNENDAEFWNRLIPEHERPMEQTEVADPGIRASRMRQLDAETLAAAVEDDLPSGPGGAAYNPGGSKKKKGGGGVGVAAGRRAGPQPGPPVEGALLRVDTWPREVDGMGNPLGLEADPRPEDFPPSLTKKDAAAFVRAARQRGVLSKLDLICADAGGAVEVAGEKARRALWYGLHRACQEALRLLRQSTPAASTPAPDSAAGEGSSATGAEGGGGGKDKKGHKQPEAKLDWFGVEVRAQELLDILRQWKLVERRLGAVPEPAAQNFKLSNAETPALTQWMRTAEWGPQEDAMLLLGAWRHGINAWDKIAGDADLGLAEKLQLAVADQIKTSGKDRETRERHALAMARILQPEKLPKASHLETRVYGVLRELEKSQMRPSKPLGGSAGLKTRAGSRPPLPPAGGPSAATRISPAAALSKHAAAHEAAASRPKNDRDEAYQAAENVLGAETLVVVRKIRTLQRKGQDMDAKLVVSKTRKYIATIGDRITAAAAGDTDLRHSLWEFVSQYTENQETGEQLESLYDRMQQPHHQHPHKSDSEVGGASLAPMPVAPPPEEGELAAAAVPAAGTSAARALSVEEGELQEAAPQVKAEPAGDRLLAQQPQQATPAVKLEAVAAEVKPEAAAAQAMEVDVKQEQVAAPAAQPQAPAPASKQEAVAAPPHPGGPQLLQAAAPVVIVQQRSPQQATAPPPPPQQPQQQQQLAGDTAQQQLLQAAAAVPGLLEVLEQQAAAQQAAQQAQAVAVLQAAQQQAIQQALQQQQQQQQQAMQVQALAATIAGYMQQAQQGQQAQQAQQGQQAPLPVPSGAPPAGAPQEQPPPPPQ